jgi:hypothetical protein
MVLTINACVVRLNISLFHRPVLHHERISLGSSISKDGGAIEQEVERLSEFAGRIAKKPDLIIFSQRRR